MRPPVCGSDPKGLFRDARLAPSRGVHAQFPGAIRGSCSACRCEPLLLLCCSFSARFVTATWPHSVNRLKGCECYMEVQTPSTVHTHVLLRSLNAYASRGDLKGENCLMLNQGPPERLPACIRSRGLQTTMTSCTVHPKTVISRNRLKICDFGLCLESNFSTQFALSRGP